MAVVVVLVSLCVAAGAADSAPSAGVFTSSVGGTTGFASSSFGVVAGGVAALSVGSAAGAAAAAGASVAAGFEGSLSGVAAAAGLGYEKGIGFKSVIEIMNACESH